MQGVIIAAGESSRLESKFLLPVFHEGKMMPLFQYQILWLEAHGCKHIRAVIAQWSVLPLVWDRIEYVVQKERKGVCDAINLGCNGVQSVVLACDNVIDWYEPLPLASGHTVTGRDVPGWMKPELDCFDGDKLVRGGDGPALTYPFVTAGCESLTPAHVVRRSWNNWYDIGTHLSYYNYLKSC